MKDDGNRMYVEPAKRTYCHLTVNWSKGQVTESYHATRNQAEEMAIQVLTASGNVKNGRVADISITEHVGKMPETNPHGI